MVGCAWVHEDEVRISVRGIIRLVDVPPPPRQVNLSPDPALDRLLPEGIVLQEAVVDTDRGLRWAFVHLLGVPVGATPTASVTLETRRGVLTPHVVGLAPGQPLAWKNGDVGVGHSISSGGARPWAGGFRSGPPPTEDVLMFDVEGVGYRLRCDVHPWEVGYACVVPHSFWAVTRFGGMYEIRGVPPGRYEMEVWHEACETQRVTIDVHPGATELRRDVELRLKPR